MSQKVYYRCKVLYLNRNPNVSHQKKGVSLLYRYQNNASNIGSERGLQWEFWHTQPIIDFQQKEISVLHIKRCFFSAATHSKVQFFHFNFICLSVSIQHSFNESFSFKQYHVLQIIPQLQRNKELCADICPSLINQGAPNKTQKNKYHSCTQLHYSYMMVCMQQFKASSFSICRRNVHNSNAQNRLQNLILQNSQLKSFGCLPSLKIQ